MDSDVGLDSVYTVLFTTYLDTRYGKPGMYLESFAVEL